jgi:hypothetical protein
MFGGGRQQEYHYPCDHRSACNPILPWRNIHPVPGELQICAPMPAIWLSCYNAEMRDLVILFVHVIATLTRLLGPGGIRSVVAESVLVKQQLLILNRTRQRAPNLRTFDRLVAGLCALFIRPSRLVRSAIVLEPRMVNKVSRALNSDLLT